MPTSTKAFVPTRATRSNKSAQLVDALQESYLEQTIIWTPDHVSEGTQTTGEFIPQISVQVPSAVKNKSGTIVDPKFT